MLVLAPVSYTHLDVYKRQEEEYAEFAERLSAYNMSQAEFIRQAITGTARRPIITVSPVNDELLEMCIRDRSGQEEAKILCRAAVQTLQASCRQNGQMCIRDSPCACPPGGKTAFSLLPF